jgi:DNA-binding response OmpR family regulator
VPTPVAAEADEDASAIGEENVMATVLVVDDDPQMRRMVVRMLAAQHQMFEAGDGQEGLKIFRTHRPAFIITDILMPKIEGLEMIREIRRVDPAVRVIAMSGGGATQPTMFLNFARTFGADAILEKPFRASELLETVERLLSSGKDALAGTPCRPTGLPQ